MDLSKQKGRPINWPTTIAIVLIHILAFGLAPLTFNWSNFLAFFVLYVVTGLGITLGFHRYFTHNSFEAKSPFLEAILAFAGSLALQGTVTGWVVDHFQHHNQSDKPEDPHSSREGFWWSHLFWLFYEVELNPMQVKLKQKLLSDPVIAFFDKKIVFIGSQVLVGLILLWIGGLDMVVWGFLVRVVFVWHVTWFINSACHLWGFTTYPESGDYSKNLWWMGLLAFGEGWHNNHHMYQNSPRHGLKWWQIDVTWYLIKVMSIVKLTSYNRKFIPN
ncbi:MAG: acyl-CoA desaturase [Patescibacteria group bacterium]